MTAEEFYDFCHRPENRDRHFELEQGEVVEVSRPGEQHGYVCGNIARILGNFTFQRRKGYVCSNDTGVIWERSPDTVKGPDVVLYDESRRYDELAKKYPERHPRLIVEVRSPSGGTMGAVSDHPTATGAGVRLKSNGVSSGSSCSPRSRNTCRMRARPR
jgi:Uma2 family endonuclease